MKGLKLFSILCALVMIFIVPTSVFAADTEKTETLPELGITPDSPFYFMDKWGKQIAMVFTFNAENKARKALQYADERMAEIEAMMNQSKVKEATEASNEYQYCIQSAVQQMEQAKSKGEAVAEKMALMTEKHLETANRLSDNAAQDARALMTQTREQTKTCQESALANIAQVNPEKAIQLNIQLMERQLSRIQVESENPEAADLQQRLEEFNCQRNLGAEISEIARGLGKETAVDQLVSQATAHHLEVLAQVQERVQGEAREAVGSAIQNCIQNQELLVNRLQEQNQLGPVPQEIPMQNNVQNRVEQSNLNMTETGSQIQAGPNNTSNTATQTSIQNHTQTQTDQGTQGAVGTTETQTQTRTQTQIENQTQTQTNTQSGQITQNTSESGTSSTAGNNSQSSGSGQAR
jgi:hypothetical protein